MEKLFSNETTVEKVLYVDGMHSDHDDANSKIAQAFMLAYAIIIVVVIALLAGTDLKWWISVLIGFGLTLITTVLRVKLITMGEISKQDTHVTGEKYFWRYDFYEEGFTAEKDGEKTNVRYEDVSRINDTGSSYQIRAGEQNFTVKKSGFSPAEEQRMVELFKRYPCGMFLKDVQVQERMDNMEESE
ncbi:MAG: YcxB family protein [Ruminococcus sp.]|nr:YcxB family protein [Ruminococcus sp.]